MNDNQITQAERIVDATHTALVHAAQVLAAAVGQPVALASKGGTQLGTVAITGEITRNNCWDLFPSTPVAQIFVA